MRDWRLVFDTVPAPHPPTGLKPDWFTSTALSMHQESGTIFRAEVVTRGLNYLSLLHQGRKERGKKNVWLFFGVVGGEACLHFPCFMHTVYIIFRQLKIHGFGCAWGLPLFALGVLSPRNNSFMFPTFLSLPLLLPHHCLPPGPWL